MRSRSSAKVLVNAPGATRSMKTPSLAESIRVHSLKTVKCPVRTGSGAGPPGAEREAAGHDGPDDRAHG